MFDIFGKLGQIKQKMAEGKEKLAAMTISAEAGNGAVKVTVDGNRLVKSIEIAPNLLAAENKEELEDLLVNALNRALKEGEEAWENQIKDAAGMLGSIL